MSTTSKVENIGVTILYDCGVDVTEATSTYLLIRRPKRTLATRYAATISGRYLSYTSLAGDFDQPGVYEVEPELVLGSFSGRGKLVPFLVDPRLAT